MIWEDDIKYKSFYDIRVGDEIYVWEAATGKLEETKVFKVIYGEKESCVETRYGRCYFTSEFNKTWFADAKAAVKVLDKINNPPIDFGDTVRLISSDELGIVYNVTYSTNDEGLPIALFSVALENRYANKLKGEELEIVGKSFKDVVEAFNSGKKTFKDALLFLLQDTPAFKRKKTIKKKDVLAMIEHISTTE